MGGHEDLIKKIDRHLENLNSLFFITDGAGWIWKWIYQYRTTETGCSITITLKKGGWQDRVQ
jgi:hypothetical protein